MADVALIVGNGFDIDMGLPSRYSDFIRSKEWNDAVSGFNIYLQQKDYQNHSLIAQLQMASTNSQWFDIEQEIHRFIVSHPDNTERDVRDIRSEFEVIKKALTNYLKRITSTFTADNSKVSTALHYRMRECPLMVTEIYFNYTYPHQYIKLPIQQAIFNGAQHWVTFVHGSLRDNDIVLGCDLQEGEQVNRQLSFMYKYNQLKKANHIAKNILEAKEIIFFGHSINEMDFGYFRDFFKAASAAPQPIRHLTIITYDEQSERNIKDNIRNQGISVTELYNNLWTFDFIHTKNVYDGKKEDVEKWEGMMNRIMEKDRHGI